MRARHFRLSANGRQEELPNVTAIKLGRGESVRGHSTSGGGYGDPLERDPRRVLKDVLENYETIERARTVYGVVFSGSVEDETLAIDGPRTGALRQKLANASKTFSEQNNHAGMAAFREQVEGAL